MITPKIKFIGKTLSGTYIIHYNETLYYKKYNCNIVKKDTNVAKTLVYRDKIIILKDFTEYNTLIVYNEDFLEEKSVNIKDKAFDVDEINNYMRYTNRKISNIYISHDNLFILFESK